MACDNAVRIALPAHRTHRIVRLLRNRHRDILMRLHHRLLLLAFHVCAFLAVTLACVRAANASGGESTVPVKVDERVELLTIVARLAGAQEFLMSNSASPYAERVAKHFGPFANHPAIAAYQALRQSFGASYDAIPSLALHLEGLPSLAERIPFDTTPPRLDSRWDLVATRAFLVQLRDFAAVSKASEFFAGEAAFYAACEQRIAPVLADAKAVPWFDAFFGAKPGATYVVIPGLLCGGNNFGVGVRFPDQPQGGADAPKRTPTSEEIRPVLGCYRWDSAGLPIFDASTIGIFVHELCHSYTNPIVDQHLDALADGGQRLFPLVARRMSRMAYATWQTVMYESFVRASVIRYLADVQGAEAATAEAAAQTKEGFTWVPDLAELLKRYAAARDRYPTLGSFVPEVAEFFRARVTAMEADAARREATAPKLVTMTPANGAVDVEPSTTSFVLQFDRPMKRNGWSLVGSKENVPEVVGTPAWNSARTVLTLSIRLVPGRTYRFSLNSERFTGFQAEDGTPLAPVDVTFSVKGF